MVECFNARCDRLSHGGNMIDEVAVVDLVEDRERRGRRHRVTAECRAVLSGSEQFRGRACRDGRPDGQPAAEPLGESHDVRHDPRGLVCEKRSGTTDSRLHLVEDEQCAVLGGQPARVREVVRRRNDDTGFSEDRLENHRRGLRRHGGGQGLDVAVGHEVDPCGHRFERCALGRLTGHGERTHGASVKCLVRGHDLRPAGESGQLECRLVGFGSGVAEEHPARPPELVEKTLGEFDDPRVDVQIRDVTECLELLGHRGHDRGMRVTQCVHRDATE